MSELKTHGPLPDGSGFTTGSLPLPKNHWIYQSEVDLDSPAPFRRGTDDPERQAWAQKIIEAARFAIRGATQHGKEMDFDPDALVLNMVVGMLGYWTPDGKRSTGNLGNSVQAVQDEGNESEADVSLASDMVRMREQLESLGVLNEWQDFLSIRHLEEWHRRQHEGPPQNPPVVSQSFLPGLGTIRECCDCKSLVAGGPTRCDHCAREVESGVSKEQSNIVKVTPKGTEEWPPGWVGYVGGKL